MASARTRGEALAEQMHDQAGPTGIVAGAAAGDVADDLLDVFNGLPLQFLEDVAVEDALGCQLIHARPWLLGARRYVERNSCTITTDLNVLMLKGFSAHSCADRGRIHGPKKRASRLR